MTKWKNNLDRGARRIGFQLSPVTEKRALFNSNMKNDSIQTKTTPMKC